MHTRLTVLSTPPEEGEAGAEPLFAAAPESLDAGLEPVRRAAHADGEPAFWLCAPAPGGATPATRVWGLWMDGAILFSTDTESVAPGDASAFHASVVHADGEGIVLVEGIATRVEDAGTLSRFATQCAAKYGFEPDPHDPDTPIYELAPT
jgi:hypothetical protein